MASADTINPSAQVPLNTIPISPDDGNPSSTSTATNGDPVTVLHDKDNFNVKHPLMNEWTLWFTKPPSGKVRTLLPHDLKEQADTSLDEETQEEDRD